MCVQGGLPSPLTPLAGGWKPPAGDRDVAAPTLQPTSTARSRDLGIPPAIDMWAPRRASCCFGMVHRVAGLRTSEKTGESISTRPFPPGTMGTLEFGGWKAAACRLEGRQSWRPLSSVGWLRSSAVGRLDALLRRKVGPFALFRAAGRERPEEGRDDAPDRFFLNARSQDGAKNDAPPCRRLLLFV